MRMSALLHIVDSQGPAASRWLAQVAREHVGGAVVVSLGHACESAPHPKANFAIPFSGGSIALAGQALQRLSESLHTRAIVAWGSRASAVAIHARDAAERWLVLDTVPSVHSIPFDAQVICLSDAVADRAGAAGWPPMRMRVIQPPSPCISKFDLQGEARAKQRDAWKISADAFVVGLLPCAKEEGDALAAFHTVGRLRLAQVQAYLVVDPQTRLAASTNIFARSIGARDAVIFHHVNTTHTAIAPAVDAWISMPGNAADGTVLDPAVAAGLGAPLVADAGSLAAMGIEQNVDGFVAPGRNRIGAVMLSLSRDAALRKEVAAAARVRYAGETRRQAFAAVFAEIASRVNAMDSKAVAASK